MTELKVINEQEILGKDFKFYDSIENPLFLAKDVAEWIDYDVSSCNKLLKTIEPEEKLLGTIIRAGQNREMWFVTENGLYEILMQSRKPIAKQFKHEVKKVLHSLRLNGGYIVNQENLTDEELMAKALIVAHHVIKNKNKIIEEQNQKLLEQEPKIEIYDKCINTENTYSMGEVARLLNFNKGRNDLFKRLREKHILMHNNIPYQRYTKYFDVKIRYNVHTEMNDITTRVKSCGVDFINKILKDDVDVNKLSLFD